MEQRKLRRIPVAKAQPWDIWFRAMADREWIQLDTLFGRWSISRPVWTPRLLPRLLYWGGLASIVGGVLWMLLFLLLGLGWSLIHSLQLWRLNDLIALIYDVRWLAIPLPLFLVGLAALYAAQAKVSIWLDKIGFLLAAIGLLSVLKTNFELDRDGFRNFDGLDNLITGWELLPMLSWYHFVGTGLTILSIGLFLLAIGAVRVKLLPIWGLWILTATILTLPLGWFVSASIAESDAIVISGTGISRSLPLM